MRRLRRLRSIVTLWFTRDRVERELSDELETFVAMAAADKVREGHTPEDARRLALIELGGIEQARERVRTYRHGGLLDDVGRDVRYAFRTFKRTPAFTGVVVLILALGIGTTTAVFTLIDALMLRELPVQNASRLVQVSLRPPSSQETGESLSYVTIRALAAERDIFSGAAGFTAFPMEAGQPGAITRVRGALVTGDFYRVLGLSPAQGRLLLPADDEAGAPLVAVISDRLWSRLFMRRADIIGQTVVVNRQPVTIVGVSPPGFDGVNVGSVAEITMAVAALPRLRSGLAVLLEPGYSFLRVLALPAPAVSLLEAESRLNAAWPHLHTALVSPAWDAARRGEFASSQFRLAPGATGWTSLRETYRRPLFALIAVAAVVLLIACANVASLVVARTSGRYREMAVRLAIGAGRGRLVRQLLIEALLLSMIGAGAGIVVSVLSSRFLVDLLSTGGTQVIFDLAPSARVLLFASGLGIVTGVLCGMLPALHATATHTRRLALRDDDRTTAVRTRALPALVSAQIALSLILLGGAGLFVRTLHNLRTLDPGFTTNGVLIAQLDRTAVTNERSLIDAVAAVPGVEVASLSTHTPLSGASWSEPAVPVGQSLPARDNAAFVAASPRFIDAMGIRLIAGRDFADSDVAGGVRVALVDETFAQAHFQRTSAVGQRLSTRIMGTNAELEIVGVVASTRADSLREAPAPTVYIPHAQFAGDVSTSVVVRVAEPVRDRVAALTQLLQRSAPNAPVAVRLLSDQMSATIVQERLLAALASGFGILALALAGAGLYGLMAYSVAQRSKEIGIRMALGAQAPRVVTMVVGAGARAVGIGLVAGLPMAWALSRLIGSFLFGLTPADPLTFGGAILLLLLVSVVAAGMPAFRASRIDPLRALRHD